MSQYLDFCGKYPFISFNDSPGKRNKDNYLYALETFCIYPSNYNENIINSYKNIISWNRKIVDKYDGIYTPWFTRFDDDHYIDNFIDYKDKINGVSLVCRHREGSLLGDISGLRLKTAQQIASKSDLQMDCYGKKAYGGELYKGVIGNEKKETYPSSISKLKKINEYKFNLCFENCYHELWSWDYITEKITDCFKAKTLAIYYGCYNIEEHIPKELFIDFRDYDSIESLVDRLNGISEEEYNSITENAFNFVRELKHGTVAKFEDLVKTL